MVLFLFTILYAIDLVLLQGITLLRVLRTDFERYVQVGAEMVSSSITICSLLILKPLTLFVSSPNAR